MSRAASCRKLGGLQNSPQGTRPSLVELGDVEVRNPAGRAVDRRPQPVPGRRRGDDHHRQVGTGARPPLLRSIAQLWPYASGTVRMPAGRRTRRCILSQVPYVPLGDLADRGVLPAPTRRRCPTRRCRRPSARGRAAALSSTGSTRNGDWAKVLSPGELAAASHSPGCLLDEAEGGVPRRGDLGARRAAGIHDLQPDPARTARHGVGRASPTAARFTATTPRTWSCSAKDSRRLGPRRRHRTGRRVMPAGALLTGCRSPWSGKTGDGDTA